MEKGKDPMKTLFNERNYSIIMQLYYLNKAEKKNDARLPINDRRRSIAKRVTKDESNIRFMTLRKALLKIAAIW